MGAGYPPPMKITYDLPEGDFTQVPNQLLSCEFLKPNDKITWMRLASLCRNGRSNPTIRSRSDMAKARGLNCKTLESGIRRLKKNGGLLLEGGDIVLVIPTEALPEPTIHEEIDEKPDRKHAMTQKEAWELIKEGWNKDKPEAWMRLDGSFNLPLYIAFETQAKRLNIEREDYARFTAQVCRGATADPWWSRQTMKASSVFGFSKVTDKKFENVEKLYKAGAAVESKIDYACDADILARYHEKGRTDLIKVIRLEAEDSLQATEHLNAIPDEEYDPTAAYIYFAPGLERPIHWSGRTTNSTRYLFS